MAVAQAARREPERQSPTTTMNMDRKNVRVGKQKTSLNVNRLVARPACIAGVRISLPNFRALCGLAKL